MLGLLMYFIVFIVNVLDYIESGEKGFYGNEVSICKWMGNICLCKLLMDWIKFGFLYFKIYLVSVYFIIYFYFVFKIKIFLWFKRFMIGY